MPVRLTCIIGVTVVAMLAAVCFAGPARADIAFDAPSSVDGGANATGNTAPLTWSHTVTSTGTNRILIVGVAMRNAAAQTVAANGVTYNGVVLTQLDAQDVASASRIEMWYLLNPPTGANTVSVTTTADVRMAAGATSYTGVDQTTPFGTQSKNSGSSFGTDVITATVTSDTDELVVDAVAQ